MASDPIQYSAVLADLEERKNSLSNRMVSLDSAIEGMKSLMDSAPIADLGTSRPFAPQVPARVQQTITRQSPPARPASAQPVAEKRASPAPLNIYVNAHPEWAARQVVSPHHSRSVFRKKTGRCCPKCGSSDTRVSVTKSFSDMFMFLFDYSIGRCRSCDTRFRIWKPRETELEPDTEFTEPHTVLD